MHSTPRARRLDLRPDTLRQLTGADLHRAVGGVPDAGSEQQGQGPCPGEYSSVCATG